MNAVTNDELFDEILGRINHHDVRDDIERRVYEIALASLEAEPVASCIIEDGGMCVDGFGEYGVTRCLMERTSFTLPLQRR